MKGIVYTSVLLSMIFMFAGCTDKTTETPALTATNVLSETKALAETGNADAQFRLGNMYAEGTIIPNDFTEASKWFRKAADQGHAEAQYLLGVIYSGGLSVPVDFAEGYVWFCLAAKSGFEEANADCENLAIELLPDELVAANTRIDELLEEIQHPE